MSMKKKRSKLISMLLTLVMTLSLVPTMGVTASAADNHPEASNVFVDGGKSFYNNRLYYKKGDQDKKFTGNEGDYIAHYNPATASIFSKRSFKSFKTALPKASTSAEIPSIL